MDKVNVGAPYDTEQGISEYLARGLAGLNELSRVRHEAGYVRGEKLEGFILLGNFVTDTAGNMGRLIQRPTPGEKLDYFPAVIRSEQGFELIERVMPEYQIAWSLTTGPVATEAICPICSKGWKANQAHNYESKHVFETLPLTGWEGKTLAEVRSGFELGDGKVCVVCPEKPIRNDRFVDLSLNPDFPSLKVNEYGYAGKREGVADEYVIQSGDEVHLNVWTFYHLGCWANHLAESVKAEFEKSFLAAGFQALQFEQVPNEYGSLDYRGPWFLVTTEFGKIKVGWRKRVIDLNWNTTGLKVPGVPKDRDVTCGEGWTHCWGYSKLEEALVVIRQFGETQKVKG